MREKVPETEPEVTAAETAETAEPGATAQTGGLEPGDELGRYVVRGRIGAGGMGEVYLAFDPDLDREVAVKVLRAEVAGSSASGTRRARLVREARAQARLSHPNVITVLDVGTAAGRVFVAMEYVPGTTLGAWVRERRPGWRQVLRSYLEAGRGLAAAHHAGLVHRDFKPDNVLVGRDGRVRVTDFGLARAVDAPDENASGGASGDPLSTSLTVTGSILGTPRYMAPEQHRGERTGARSDQFSFCVALYEALYGEHPFAPTDAGRAELAAAVLAGEVREPPAGAEVPAWLRSRLLRGLSADVAYRYPSMDALLAALSRDPGARRRRAIAAVAVVAVAAAGGVAAVTVLEDENAPCSAAGDRFAQVWDDDARDAVREAFAATGLSGAPAAFDRTAAVLDRYEEAWVAERREACTATLVRGEQSERLMDLRYACLDQRLAQARSLVVLLHEAAPETVARAVDAARALPETAACGDAEALTARFDPPPAGIAGEVASLREKLAAAKATETTGAYGAALAATAALADPVREAGYQPLVAEWLMQRGNLERATGDLDAAAATLDEAARVAAAAGHAEIEAHAWSTLVWIVGYRQGDFAEGHRAARHAEAHLQRLGDPPSIKATLRSNEALVYQEESKHDEAQALYEEAIELLEGTEDTAVQQASLLNNLGGLHQIAARYDEAERAHQRALEIRREVLGEEHPQVAASLNNLGMLRDATGKFEEALEYHRRALAMRVAILGEQHANVALSYQNIGEALRKLGRTGEAIEAQEKALEIRREAFGDEHKDVADSHEALANALGTAGRLDEAVAHYERALALREALGARTVDLATILSNLGTTERKRERYEEALAYFDRARAIFVEALGPEHPYVGIALFNVANVHSDMDELEAARESYQTALAIMEESLGPEHPYVAYPLTGLGENYRRMKQYARALEPLERALAIRTASPGEPLLRASTEFHLGQVLWMLGRDRGRARALLTRAEETLAGVGEAAATEHAEVAAWIRDNLE